MASPENDRKNERGRSHWGNWLAGAFAIVANIVGVVEIATTSRLFLTFVAGVLAMAGGGVWLWRLLSSGHVTRTHRRVLALNLSIMLVGAGLVGSVLTGLWRDEARGHDPHASPPPGATSPSTSAPPGSVSDNPSPSASGPTGGGPPTGGTSTEFTVPPGEPPTTTGGAPATPPRTAPTQQPANDQPFTGTVRITDPQYGGTLPSGGSLGGEVTGWTTGHQLWMSAQAEGSSTELVQGPCQVNVATFVCSGVRLAGQSGTVELIRITVVTDATAEQLDGASTLPTPCPSYCDWTHVHKG